MTWLKRWRPAPAPASPVEARKARVSARKELAAAKAQREEVDRVAASLERLLNRNGFGEAIEKAMGRRAR